MLVSLVITCYNLELAHCGTTYIVPDRELGTSKRLNSFEDRKTTWLHVLKTEKLYVLKTEKLLGYTCQIK